MLVTTAPVALAPLVVAAGVTPILLATASVTEAYYIVSAIHVEFGWPNHGTKFVMQLRWQVGGIRWENLG